MKNEEHSSLWRSIQQFPLDDPNAEITFSRKLSAKQHWSPTFTERVVEEYRKFIFLCCISPNGASPSQAVDEAWHLHLTYTKSYWIDLCKNTLGKDVHHHPSRGGDEENHKHRDWYNETLVLYQSVFGSLPPDDIWPLPSENDLRIPRAATNIRNEILALVVMLLLLPFIISAYQHRVLFPFSLTGPGFLGFFPLLAISCIVCYVIIQYEKNNALIQLVAIHFPTNATVFETAQFLYGKKRVIQAAIVDMVRRNLLTITSDKLFTVHRYRYYAPVREQNPLIPGFEKEERNCVTYETIAENWYNDAFAPLATLQKLHAIANKKESFFKMYHVLFIPFGVGITRLFQGWVNGKPVAYLFLEMVLLLIVSLIIIRKYSRKGLMNKKVKETAKQRQHVGLLYEDIIVGDYAMKGGTAISGFSDGLVLISIFGGIPFVERLNQGVVNFIDDTSGGSGGSDGGGCSGGGSCGGGCGGGCGGCGS